MQGEILAKYWSLTFNEYKNICSYFNIQPKKEIYEHLKINILKLSKKKYAKNNFYYYLSDIKKNYFNILFLDFITNYFFKDHSFRYILKLVLNFHECNNQDLNFEKKTSIIFILFNFSTKLIKEFFLLILFSILIFIIFIYFKLTKPDLANKIRNKKILLTGPKGSLGKKLLEIILSFEFKHIYLIINNEINVDKNSRISFLRINFENFDNLKNQFSFDELDLVILAHGFKNKEGSNLDLKLIKKTFEINFFSIVKLVTELSKNSKKIIIISSLGRYHGMPKNSAYNPSKSALSNWVESLNLEINDKNIIVYEPGLFLSNMTKKNKSLFLTDINNVAQSILSLKNKKIHRYPFYFYLLSRALEFSPFKVKKFIINLFNK
jgi:short-subunit dehydrogenase